MSNYNNNVVTLLKSPPTTINAKRTQQVARASVQSFVIFALHSLFPPNDGLGFLGEDHITKYA